MFKGKHILKLLLSLVVFSGFFTTYLAAQNSGELVGEVVDSVMSEPIVGANIYIADLSRGDATDINGRFQITNLPAGTYQVRFSYLSYQTRFLTVQISAGQTTRLNVGLRSEFVVGEEVTVLAQAAGQAAAIKEQLQSNTIVNVVSAERISELPDQNAAESVGRLPGVSVQRSAGEASKVVVRGLSPKFNSITVNGVRIPSTDPNDRSVDLSLIPPDVLAGIEVFKALTPDKDGDAVGGTINLLVREAPSGFRGDVRLQTGYHGLENELGQYKGSLSLSDRFFNDKLGVLVTGSMQKANRGSEAYEGTYAYESGVALENLNLVDRAETRERLGLGLNLDVKVGNGVIYSNNFIGRTDREELRLRKRYRVNNTRIEYDIRDRELFNTVYSNSLGGNHRLGTASIDWLVSNSYTLSKTPFSSYSRFLRVGGYDPIPPTDVSIFDVPDYTDPSISSTYFQYGSFNPARSTDRDFTAQVDMKVPFDFGQNSQGYVKFGGKFRQKTKETDADEFRTDHEVVSQIGQDNPGEFDLYNNTHIAMSNFVDGEIGSDFLDGEFAFGPRLIASRLNNFYKTYSSSYETNRFVDLQDYTAGEDIYAAYIMTEVNLGARVMILPGLRYEYAENFYEGSFGDLYGNLGQYGEIVDTTGGQNYGELLPMVHVKFSISDNIDLRLAATKTLNRPDYYSLVPYLNINDAEETVAEGNSELKHATSWNYDAFLSFFASRYGYLSLGAYYKKIEGVDYSYERRVTSGPYSPYTVTSVINSNVTDVYGVEAELQTDFRYLPKPFDGLIFSGNIAFIKSETKYPFNYDTEVRDPNPPYESIYVDTARTGPLIGQPDVVGGFSLGYEKGGFSARISLSYQTNILQTIGQPKKETNGPFITQDGYSNAFSFWDFSLNQKVGFVPGLMLFWNVNNITSEPERTTWDDNYPELRENFGWSTDLGFRYQF